MGGGGNCIDCTGVFPKTQRRFDGFPSFARFPKTALPFPEILIDFPVRIAERRFRPSYESVRPSFFA